MNARKISIVIATILSALLFSATVCAQDDTGGEAGTGDSGKLTIKHKHEIEAGIGLGLLGVVAIGGDSGGGFLPANGLAWVNVPVMYHYRLNRNIAVGGGLQIIIAGFSGAAIVGGELIGGIRLYAIKDYLWFDINAMLGFPVFFGLAPAVGHSFMINDKIGIFLKNEFLMAFSVGFIGIWNIAAGVDIRF